MSRRWTMRGQSLIEALAAMLFLIPLLIATFDLWQRQASVQAAQSASWVGAIAAHHGVAVPPLHPRGSASMMELDVTVWPTAQPAAARATEDGVFALLQPARAIGSGELGLARGQARRARAVARPAAPPGLSRAWTSEDPAAHAELPVLVDDWAAMDAAVVQGRIEALTTAGRIRSWRAVLQPMAEPLRLFEPSISRLCLGRIDPDIVPSDRLSAVHADSSDLRRRPC